MNVDPRIKLPEPEWVQLGTLLVGDAFFQSGGNVGVRVDLSAQVVVRPAVPPTEACSLVPVYFPRQNLVYLLTKTSPVLPTRAHLAPGDPEPK